MHMPWFSDEHFWLKGHIIYQSNFLDDRSKQAEETHVGTWCVWLIMVGVVIESFQAMFAKQRLRVYVFHRFLCFAESCAKGGRVISSVSYISSSMTGRFTVRACRLAYSVLQHANFRGARTRMLSGPSSALEMEGRPSAASIISPRESRFEAWVEAVAASGSGFQWVPFLVR